MPYRCGSFSCFSLYAAPYILDQDQQATKERRWSSSKPIKARQVAATKVYWGASSETLHLFRSSQSPKHDRHVTQQLIE